jgi:hypothetical protein
LYSTSLAVAVRTVLRPLTTLQPHCLTPKHQTLLIRVVADCSRPRLLHLSVLGGPLGVATQVPRLTITGSQGGGNEPSDDVRAFHDSDLFVLAAIGQWKWVLDGWQRYLVLVLVSAFSVFSCRMIPNTGFLYSATEREKERERESHTERKRWRGGQTVTSSLT